ncbi:MAG: hypothetical protein AB7V25_13875 [Mangrovibacterium sp.]
MNKFIRRLSLTVFIGIEAATGLSGQGMATNPPRLYFTTPPKGNEVRKLTVMNTGQTQLELGISVGDWDYDRAGDNRFYDGGTLKTSAANWIGIFPSSYLVLQAGERRDLEVTLNVPATADSSVSVRTAMIFLTQLNPAEVKSTGGAAIQVSIRSGTKVYHSFFPEDSRDIMIVDFKKMIPKADNNKTALQLTISVTGKLWVEGKVITELLHMRSGEKTKLADNRFYALPGDLRYIRLDLPPDLPPGRYTATTMVSFEKRDLLKMAELEFEMP